MVSFGLNADSDALLLVEGKDDEQFVYHLHNCLKLNLSAEIRPTGGVNYLLKQLRAEVQQPGRKILGAIVDADEDLNERWRKIVYLLSERGIGAPSTPNPSGTIIPSENMYPKIGIWIMPDNQSSGELEDFVFNLIDSNDEGKSLAHKYIDNIPDYLQKFKNKRTKAELIAWLANTSRPGKIGASIQDGNFDINKPIANEFTNWLTRLFDSSST